MFCSVLFCSVIGSDYHEKKRSSTRAVELLLLKLIVDYNLIVNRYGSPPQANSKIYSPAANDERSIAVAVCDATAPEVSTELLLAFLTVY